MKRGRLNRSNPERLARLRAEQFGKQAALCRTLPCCVPGCRNPAPSDPAHVRSRGAGGKDRGNVVPLCRMHHTEQGTMGIRTFQEHYELDMLVVAKLIEEEAYSD